MDPTSTNPQGTQHQQQQQQLQLQQHKTPDGSSFETFYPGVQSYTNYNLPPESSQYEFLWDPQVYHHADQPPVYQQQSPVHDPAWSQPALQRPPDPALNNYGGMQSTFQIPHYPQASFEMRQSVTPTYDARSMSRTMPSPGPYPNYAYQPALNFSSRDPNIASTQGFNAQGTMGRQPSPSLPAPNFSSRPEPNPYFAYNAVPPQHPNLQSIDLMHFGAYTDHSPRPSSHFIDPSFLTSSDLSNPPSNQYEPPSHNEHVNLGIAPTPSMPTAPTQNMISEQLAIHDGSVQISPEVAAQLQNGVVTAKPIKRPAKPRKPKDPNAPKKSRGRPKKDEVTPHPKKDGAGSSSSSDSDSDEVEPEDEAEKPPPILSGKIPEDVEGKAIYDVVQAVWSPNNRTPVPDKIRNGMALFGETIRKLRDEWKVKNEALKKAELANTAAASGLKEEVTHYRNLMETVAMNALTLGHDSHLKRLGENPYTMSAIQSFLLDRVTAGDNDGSLVTSILRLVAKFKTLDQDMLEKTKTLKILVRLTKKAGQECKTLAQNILDNAAAASKQKSKDQKPEAPESPVSVNGNSGESRRLSPQVVVPRPDAVAGTKRPRDAEGSSLPATKRPVVSTTSKQIAQASKPLALQAAERKRAEAAAPSAKVANATTNGTSTAASGKPKIAVVAAPKPATSVFSSLISASKKPGTSNAARAAAAKDKVIVDPAGKKESPPPGALQIPAQKSSFSFMDTLADMSKPKEVEPKKVDDRPPETEEERQKRLRKEERKKLRVSWKPNEDLVETRFFTHDPDEEVGPTDSMRRDVDDVGGEGRMLKLHKDLEDLDDEEESQASGEDLEAYQLPSEVDFGELPPDDRERNFLKYGGVLKPESPESEAQAKREENTLMVVYSLPSDVPSTPKEPAASTEEEEYDPIVPFGEPTEKTRSRETEYLSSKRGHPVAISATPDISAILQQMKKGQTIQQQPPVLSDLERTFNLFSQQSQNKQPTPPQPVAQQPFSGNIGGLDLQKLLAVVNARNQLQAQPVQQQPQFPQQTQTATASPNLAALLAQMQNQQPNAAPSPLQNLQNLLQGSSNSYPGATSSDINDFSRKHSRNDSVGDTIDNHDGNRNSNKKKKGNGGVAGSGGVGAGTGVTADGKLHPNFKTVVCRFWLEGKCLKGDECTFRHDEGEKV